jgi:Histidinol phosphatase and related hydrolases of the PHP family
MYRGVIHAHSTYSDGEYTLSELRDVFVASGCSFVCMTEHAEYFNHETVNEYRDECRKLSDENFLFVPGLEFTCDRRMHVLGYGVTDLVSTTNPEEVIAHINSAGGISVIAHPMDSAFSWIESFTQLPHGIETWNSKYDGRYAPRPGTFDLLQRLKTRQSQMLAFYGVDFHWKRQFRELYTSVSCEALTRNAILEKLSRGSFTGIKGNIVLPSSGDVPVALLQQFGKLNDRSMRMRRLTRKMKNITDRFGARIPAPIKGQLRRIF